MCRTKKDIVQIALHFGRPDFWVTIFIIAEVNSLSFWTSTFELKVVLLYFPPLWLQSYLDRTHLMYVYPRVSWGLQFQRRARLDRSRRGVKRAWRWVWLKEEKCLRRKHGGPNRCFFDYLTESGQKFKCLTWCAAFRGYIGPVTETIWSLIFHTYFIGLVFSWLRDKVGTMVPVFFDHMLYKILLE